MVFVENTYIVITAAMNSVTLLNECKRQGREHNLPLAKSGREHFKELCQTVERLEGEASDNTVVT